MNKNGFNFNVKRIVDGYFFRRNKNSKPEFIEYNFEEKRHTRVDGQLKVAIQGDHGIILLDLKRYFEVERNGRTQYREVPEMNGTLLEKLNIVIGEMIDYQERRKVLK